GELFNEIPDRISDAATLIGLGYAAHSNPVLGYIAACMAIMTAYVRAAGKVAGANQEFCGPMAKPHRMNAVTAAALFCAFAPGSWQSFHNPIPVGVPALALLLIILGGVWTIIRR